ncbi:crotonobetainyl-CoA--carnitine CoA-transferase [candidate division KSB1 bacterium]
MSVKEIKAELYRSEEEDNIRKEFVKHFRKCPIPDNEILQNLGLFLSSKNLSRILFMDYLYRKIVDMQGVVMEFGTRWGPNTALFSALRGIYDPFNRMRKIIGFDTFTGFPSLSDKDNTNCELIKEGELAVSKDYIAYLDKVMDFQEKDNPMSHVKRYEIIAGDAVEKIDEYLKKHPETIVALAYFDVDIYEPTKKCLEAIRPHLVKGSVLGFDELNDPDCPGETIALKEVFGLNNIRIKRYPYASRVSYFVIE